MLFLKSFSATVLLAITFSICVKAQFPNTETHTLKIVFKTCAKSSKTNNAAPVVQYDNGQQVTASSTSQETWIYSFAGPFNGFAEVAGYTITTTFTNGLGGSHADITKSPSSNADTITIQFDDVNLNTDININKGCTSLAACGPIGNCNNKFLSCITINVNLIIEVCAS